VKTTKEDIAIIIIALALLWVIVTVNSNLSKHETSEENRIKQNVEIILLQQDIKRLDIELIAAQKDLLKSFEYHAQYIESMRRAFVLTEEIEK